MLLHQYHVYLQSIDITLYGSSLMYEDHRKRELGHRMEYHDHYLKLRRIFERIIGLIDEFLPDELAIEAPFFGKNVQSMLKLGRAQGVAMAAALSRDIPIFEYAPLKIKMSITGNGRAAKEQVAYDLLINPEKLCININQLNI